MGNFRPLATKCWEKFLTLHGFKYSHTTGSHDQWKKEIPALHLKTGCKTIGCAIEHLYDWAKENC